MSRFPRTLSLILTLGLFLAACGPQTADRRPQADGGQPSTLSPGLVVLEGGYIGTIYPWH